MTDPKAWYVRNLFSHVPREYDTLLALLTFGQDRYWRAFVLDKSRPSKDGLILDVATGPGTLAADFAREISDGGLVVGVDLTRSMLETARTNLQSRNLGDRTEWVLARAENLPFKNESFSASAISLALRNVSDAKGTLAEMARVTATGGIVVSLDFTRPANKLFKLIYYDYLLGLFPILGRTISKAWARTLSYLGRSILRARTGHQIAILMQAGGVADPKAVPLTMGVVCAVYGVKEPRGKRAI